MSDHQRDESTLERLDRNELELLTELRVASAGVQVLLAFLLISVAATAMQTRASWPLWWSACCGSAFR